MIFQTYILNRCASICVDLLHSVKMDFWLGVRACDESCVTVMVVTLEIGIRVHSCLRVVASLSIKAVEPGSIRVVSWLFQQLSHPKKL